MWWRAKSKKDDRSEANKELDQRWEMGCRIKTLENEIERAKFIDREFLGGASITVMSELVGSTCPYQIRIRDKNNIIECDNEDAIVIRDFLLKHFPLETKDNTKES